MVSQPRPDEIEDSPFAEPEVDITEQGPRPRAKRFEYAWERVARESHAPEYHFMCCGTTYGAMTAQALALTAEVHQRMRHGG